MFDMFYSINISYMWDYDVLDESEVSLRSVTGQRGIKTVIV